MAKRILVVEDDRTSQRLTEYTLKQAGYEISIASDGIDGLKRAREDHPDLVLLDIMLPGMDGYEVCHRLRQDPETATLPILMISAKAHQEDKDTGIKVGADVYLTKPVEPSEILAKVESLLSNTV